jgi:hypothetical protein
LKALRAALKKLRAKAAADGAPFALDRVEGLFGFFGMSGPALSDDAEDVGGPELALEYLRSRAQSTTTFRPMDAAEIPGASGTRVFVLGPPTNTDLLAQEDLRAEQKAEAFLTGLSLNEQTSLAAAVLHSDDPTSLAPEERQVWELSHPFDRSHRMPLARETSSNDFLLSHYSQKDEWRRIEDDWLRAASTLALKLDTGTNNTSLALAIELRRTGKILLFPGDAQAGAWLSWAELKWDVDGKTLNIAELLRRTVFYKVGHHASHNGTLKASGLEKMGDDLIAMIPVHRKTADKLKGWHMPHEKLYKLLKTKTRGRVLRSDQDPDPAKPPGASSAQWGPFQKLIIDPLYFQLTFTD